MNSIEAMVKRRQANHVILCYAIAAGTISAITAIDPEPLTGTALMIFADTPLVTAVTFSMIVHLALIYNQKDLLKDGMIMVASLSAGLVLGALGAKILGRIVPVLGTVNNAIISFTLHYATGHVIIDFFEEERKITDLTLKYVTNNKAKYEEEGKKKGKEAFELSKKMSSSDKKELKRLTKEYRTTAKNMKNATENKDVDQSIKLSDELLRIGEEISQIYAKYGYSID